MRIFTVFSFLFSTMLCSFSASLTFWGPGAIDGARSMAIAPNGDFWIGVNKVAIYSSEGQLKEIRETPDSEINAIVFTSNGTPVLGTNHGTITWLLPNTHKTISNVGSRYSPWGIAIDKDDYLYATDAGGKVVRQFNTDGFPRKVFDPGADEAFERPFDIAVDSQGRIIVSDEQKNGLWIFAHDGTFIKRILTDMRFWRLKMGADGLLYAVSNNALSIDLTTEKIVQRYPNTPGGLHAACAFAVDKDKNIYVGSINDGIIRKVNPEGKTLLTFGPSYKAILQLPEGGFIAGAKVDMPLKVEKISDQPVGKVPPIFSLKLRPAVIPGEPDSSYSNSQIASAVFQQQYLQTREAQFKALERILPIEQQADKLTVTVPNDIPAEVYNLFVSVDAGIENGQETQQSAMRVLQAGATANLTLFIPRQRSVFQYGEQIEINTILRTAKPFPAGSLRLSLATRNENDMQALTPAKLWIQTPLLAGNSRTLTYRAAADTLAPGRYLLLADADFGTEKLHDSWPITIVSDQQATRFRILFPEWSAGYTHIWGPFTGKGMRTDMQILANEGITLYDESILEKAANPPFNPTDVNMGLVNALMNEAAADPSLPASERYLPASPLEIELQEALRNGIQMQREIWGSHFLDDWGHANPLSIPRDNRIAQLWTQWQREWPSWLGHRYLTLSLTSPDAPESMALREKLAAQGIAPVAEKDLIWARNEGSRRLISDSPAPPDTGFRAITSDAKGNIYIGSPNGIMVVYDTQGKEIREQTIPSVMDLVVATDGTIYGVNDGYIAVIPVNGAPRTFPVDCSQYSPRSIVITNNGELLINDKGGKRILRYNSEGKLLGAIGNSDYLKGPSGLALFPDGALAVGDENSGNVVIFNARGEFERTIPQACGGTPGGKNDLAIDRDGVIWSTNYSWLNRMKRDGTILKGIGKDTFAPGSTILPTALDFTPKGNLLIASVSLPYPQEVTPELEPVFQLGLRTLFADLRTDRTRITWQDQLLISLFFPIKGQEGSPDMTLQAFARLTPEDAWLPLTVTAQGGGIFNVSVPQIVGKAQLLVVYDKVGIGVQSKFNAIFPLEIKQKIDPQEEQQIADLTARELAWKKAWAHSRMGTLVRWTQLSDIVAGRATQNTAPMNWGTPDMLAAGVYPSYRRDAVVAETHNSGHDHGDLVFSGAWYAASSFAGPNPKPAWSSLLEWYWGRNAAGDVRPRRDLILFMGAGASGVGTGRFVQQMDKTQLEQHRALVAQIRQVGEATMNLTLPGRNGVAILRSITQESMDPYNNEHFWTAHAAWYDLLRLHVPVGVVDEESIAADMLIKRGYKAVLLPMIQFPLEKSALDGLERFRRSGGEIWCDMATRIAIPGAKQLKARYRPAEIQDLGYWVHSGYGVGAFDGNWEYWMFQQGSNQRLPAVKEAFARFATMPIATDERDIILQQRDGGQASYIFASNDHYPDLPLNKTWLAGDAPAPFQAKFTLNGGAIYDVFAKKQITGNNMTVDFTTEMPARIYAVLPTAISKLELRTAIQKGTLFATVEIKDAANKIIPAVVPVELSFRDPNGKEVAHRWTTSTADGSCRTSIPLGWMATPGNWTVTAVELLSGSAAPTANVVVGDEALAKIVLDDSPALLFDQPTITKWLENMQGQEVWIPLDKAQDNLRPQAERPGAGTATRRDQRQNSIIDRYPRNSGSV